MFDVVEWLRLFIRANAYYPNHSIHLPKSSTTTILTINRQCTLNTMLVNSPPSKDDFQNAMYCKACLPAVIHQYCHSPTISNSSYTISTITVSNYLAILLSCSCSRLAPPSDSSATNSWSAYVPPCTSLNHLFSRCHSALSNTPSTTSSLSDLRKSFFS